MSRFLISCGGTGGHLSPGIALAEGLIATGHEARLLISMKRVDARLVEAAATLGASETTTLRRVVLPLATPSIAAGLAMSGARALGEFGATITFAGNLPGTTQTMPLAVYVALQSDLDAAVVLSVLLLAMAFGLLLGLRSAPGGWAWNRSRARA